MIFLAWLVGMALSTGVFVAVTQSVIDKHVHKIEHACHCFYAPLYGDQTMDARVRALLQPGEDSIHIRQVDGVVFCATPTDPDPPARWRNVWTFVNRRKEQD